MKNIIAICLLVLLFPQSSARVEGEPVIVVAGQSNALGTFPYLRDNLPDYMVINCAVGGTSITQWERGKPIYEDCVTQVNSLGREVAWIFFMQGERDSKDYDVAIEWKALFYVFAHDFREDIASGKIPIIVAQIGAKPTDETPRPYWEMIQTKQSKIPVDHPNLFVFPTLDLPYCPSDGHHFCGDGYNEISLRAIELAP